MTNIKEHFKKHQEGTPKRLLKMEFAIYKDGEHVNPIEAVKIITLALGKLDAKGYRFEGSIEETHDLKVVEKLKELRENN